MTHFDCRSPDIKKRARTGVRARISLLATREILLQRAVAGAGRTGGVGADHTGLIGVETTLSGSAAAARVGRNRVAHRRRRRGVAGKREDVSALGAAGKNAVHAVG